MPITVTPHEYRIGSTTHDGAIVRDNASQEPAPGVLVFPGWEGRSGDQEEFGQRLAALGYVAFAVDLFGKGVRGDLAKDNSHLIAPFLQDRKRLRELLLAHLAAARAVPGVQPKRMAAIGFCFGGLCVLDLARAGADVQLVISFHGLFAPPEGLSREKIRARVVAYHGWADPMVTPEAVTALGRELTEAGADWQLHAFGGTTHAFMAKNARRPEVGIQYDERAAKRAWRGAIGDLTEAFGK